MWSRNPLKLHILASSVKSSSRNVFTNVHGTQTANKYRLLTISRPPNEWSERKQTQEATPPKINMGHIFLFIALHIYEGKLCAGCSVKSLFKNWPAYSWGVVILVVYEEPNCLFRGLLFGFMGVRFFRCFTRLSTRHSSVLVLSASRWRCFEN